jgi:AraC family transcriptional regulator
MRYALCVMRYEGKRDFELYPPNYNVMDPQCEMAIHIPIKHKN